VLTLCARSGLVQAGVTAVDGTKVHANAARDANLDYGQLAREILEEAKATDAAEDERFGDARGDELPEEFETAQGRRGWPREAKQRLEAERAANPSRCRAAFPSAFGKPSAGWKKSCGPRCVPTALLRPIGRGAG